jgi:hypothetical protein
MQDGDEQAFAARQVLAGAFHGVLSTHSLDHPGYPFGSVVPYVLGQDGLPLLLLSPLSRHTRNLDADARCALTMIEPGSGDVQQRGRLSAIGDATPSAAGPDAERYFRYFPQAQMYAEELGFRFYRSTALRFHWNGGFATARWLGVDRVARANPLSRQAQQRIIAHMNRDHTDALRRYLPSAEPPADRDGVSMLGIDAEGIDLRVADRLFRVALTRAIGSPSEARDVLVEMATARR